MSVVTGRFETSGPIPVEAICDSAKVNDTVLVVGIRDGEISVAFSESGDAYTAIGLLESAKIHILKIIGAFE